MVSMSRRRVLKLGALAPIAGFVALRTRGSMALIQGSDAPATASPAASCGTPIASPEASPGATPQAEVKIKMTDALRFEPDHVTIHVGQTVTWENASAIPHTSTCDPAANPVEKAHPEFAKLPEGAETWNSGYLDNGQTFSHTFTVPGEYDYFCIPHVLSSMRGVIEVTC